MFSLQTSSAGFMDGRKFSAANTNGQTQSANPNSEQPTQSQGPSPFSNSSPALQNVQQMANSNSASSSSQSNHQSPITNFPAGPFPPLHPFIQMAMAARNLATNSPQQKPGPSPSSSASFFNSTNSSSSTAAQQQLFNGVFHPSSGHFPPIGHFPSSFHHNLFLLHQQQMQQQQQQYNRQQQQSSTIGFEHQSAAQQQLLLQIFSALTSSNNGGIGNQIPTMEGGNNFQQISANKKLERDSDGNALCPACHEPIGKESGDWAKHLELEKAKLQKTIQRLKKRAQEENSDERDANVNEGNLNGSATDEKGRREVILEKICQNQRKRLNAKMEETFYSGSNLLAKLIDGKNIPMPNSIEQNGRKEEEDSQQMPKIVINKMQKQQITDQIGKDGETTQENGNEKNCFECKSETSSFLVLNVQSKMFQCLDCFRKFDRQQNGATGKEQSNNLNGFVSNNGFAHQEQQKTSTNRKRLSPSFSVLELASNAVENDLNSENQKKRQKLELKAVE